MRRADLGASGYGRDPIAATEAQGQASGVEALAAGALLAFIVRHRAAMALALLLGVTAALYAPTFGQWFTTDDFLFVNAAQDAKDTQYVKEAFDFRGAPPFPEGRFYRPLHSSAFIALYDVFGLHVWGYHLWSLALHLASTVFVWLICLRLTKNQLASGLAAALFALHPAHASAVGWISNNNALMATCAALASFLCFMRAGDAPQRRWVWYGASVAGFSASLLFHPEAGSLLGALVAYRVFVQNESWRQSMEWRGWVDLVPFAAAAATYAGIQSWMAHQGYLPQAGGLEISWHMVRVYLAYLSIAVYPTPAEQHSLPSAAHVFAAFALLFAIAGLLAMRWKSRPNVAMFAVVWFLIALLPLSTTNFSDAIVDVAVRKLYVAGPALAIMLALMLTPVIEAPFAMRAPLAGAAVVLVVALGLSLAGWLAVDRQREQAWGGDQSRAYVTELRETYRELPAGSRLHLVGLPAHLAILTSFYDDYVTNLVGLYYEDIEVVIERDGAVESPGSRDVVFQYPPPAGVEGRGP